MKMYKIFKIKRPVWYLANETNIYIDSIFLVAFIEIWNCINIHGLISIILVMLFILSKALTNF